MEVDVPVGSNRNTTTLTNWRIGSPENTRCGVIIVSGDQDLLVLENVGEIAIVTPAQAITLIEAAAK
jgi:hypothetical protein